MAADAAAVWSEIMPQIKNAVTGVGLWQALNNSRAVAYEDGTFILGVPHEMGELAGHLRMQNTRVLVERYLTEVFNTRVTLRVIEGTSQTDWDYQKRKDEEARRLQMVAQTKVQAEIEARSSWEGVYENISRHYATVANKSLPQNRAKFFIEAVDMMIEALQVNPVADELSERNYARCIERISQYSEVPSVIVAYTVLTRSQGG